MKNKDYIKKYRLDAVTIFPHGQFAIDWGNDFLSRIEVWREFGSWNENTFWRLYEEMRKKWESLDLKCKVQLPEKLWTYMRREIFIPTLENEFPDIAKDKDFIDGALIPDLLFFFEKKIEQHGDSFTTYLYANVAFEWNHHYNEKAIGDLEYRPNMWFNKLYEKVDAINSHVLWYALEALSYQLKKKAAAKAKVQFRIRKEQEDKRKTFGGAKFDWWSFVVNGYFRYTVNSSDYLFYFEKLNLKFNNDITEEEINKAYRNLAKIHHPDKNGGCKDKFEEIAEAKNKCIELVKLILNNKKF